MQFRMLGGDGCEGIRPGLAPGFQRAGHGLEFHLDEAVIFRSVCLDGLAVGQLLLLQADDVCRMVCRILLGECEDCLSAVGTTGNLLTQRGGEASVSKSVSGLLVRDIEKPPLGFGVTADSRPNQNRENKRRLSRP